MAEEYKALDAADTTQAMVALQEWINGLGILPSTLYREYYNGVNTFCIKCNGGIITDEDITGGLSAEGTFSIYYLTNNTPDSAGQIFKPLNDLAAWFHENGTTGLVLGDRQTPNQIKTIQGPTDLHGQDDDGNTEIFSVFSFTYDEDAK